ncbi:DUF6518 family protein [Hamadaea sp. NPDC051192]|uniref:DUF6518 family protein n=1 Tax=Hamadaea sp. NPDC051192 TaxID=3154940 RepID=UPI00342502FC
MSSGVRTVLLATLGGLVLGVITLALRDVLPGDWSRLVNSGAVWVVGAYAAGALIRRPGWRLWLSGVAVLVGAVIGYYALLAVERHELVSPAHLTGPIGWSIVGLASGPVFAIAGSWWRDARLYRSVVSLCLLGGVFLAEGAYLLISDRPVGEAVIVAAVGLLVPVVLGRSRRERLLGLAALAPVAVLGLGGYLVLNSVLDVAFTRSS